MNEIESEVLRMAASGVLALQQRSGGSLDYSERSLAMVEEILAEASGYFAELPEEHIRTVTQQVGCYILAVAHRQFGGEFFWHDDLEQPVLVVGEPEKHIAIVTWRKVRGRLSGDAGNNIPFFYSGFAERVASAPAGTNALYI